MATDGDPNSNPDQRGLLDLLKVDLVKEEIMSYLNFQDLMCFSEVSKGSLSAVRSSKGYKRKATLVIGSDAVESDLAIVKKFASTWTGKNVKIDAAIPVELVRSRPLGTLLMNVESVTLHLYNESRTATVVFRFLTELLEKSKNLKHLELDPVILVKSFEALSNFFPFPTDLKVKNLESLQIMKGSTVEWTAPFKYMMHGWVITWLNKQISSLVNLKKMSSYYDCRDARPVQYGLSHRDNSRPHFTSDYAEGLLETIKRHQGTLEELEIADIDIMRFREIRSIAFPKLKRLAILDSTVPGIVLQDFLAKQLELDSLNVSVTEQFPFEIFNVIEEKQTKLTDLRIRVGQFDPAGGVDWNFLKKLSGLVCLVIRQVNTRSVDDNDGLYGYGEDILSCVPSSVKVLVIEGFQSFWRQTTPAAERNIWRRLSHVKNLKELSFLRSNDSFSDEGLQDLISNCPNLTALCISHCSQLTKFGVTGENANGERTGVSLDQLKGLRHLSIRSCLGIRKVDLFPVIKFDFLTSFYFDGLEGDEIGFNFELKHGHPPDGIYFDLELSLDVTQKRNMKLIAGLLSQSPSLEELGLRLSFTTARDCHQVKQMSRRLTHVVMDLPNLRLVSENDSALPLGRYRDQFY